MNTDKIKCVAVNFVKAVAVQTASMALNAAVLTFVSRKVSSVLDKRSTEKCC